MNRARSAIAPEAIVTAVAAKTAWKKKNAAVLRFPLPLEPTAVRSLPDRKNPSVPHQELLSAERQRVPDRQECERSDAHVGQVLGQDVGRVLDPRQTALQQRETRLHREHENAGQHDPGIVEGGLYGGHRIARLRGRRRGQ